MLRRRQLLWARLASRLLLDADALATLEVGDICHGTTRMMLVVRLKLVARRQWKLQSQIWLQLQELTAQVEEIASLAVVGVDSS